MSYFDDVDFSLATRGANQPEKPKEPAKSRNAFAAVNDTVIEFANAAAGGVGAVADFVSPGNALSNGIDGFIKSGQEKQSDVVKADKAEFAKRLEDSTGVGDDLAAVGKYVINSPIQTLAQAAGSFVLPGAAVKAGRGVAGALGLGERAAANSLRAGNTVEEAAKAGQKVVSRGGLAGGAAVGAAMGGGDAAGSAYDLVMKTPDEILTQNPQVVDLLARGIPLDQVREQVATEAARKASVVPAVVGAASGLVGAERILAGVAKTGGKRILKTGAVEGLTEGFEEGVTQYSGRAAASEYNPEIDPTKNVAAMAAMGAVTGAPIGAAVAAISRPDLQPALDKSQEPNSPLSKAAVAGNTGAAADAELATQLAQNAQTATQNEPAADPLAERTANILEQSKGGAMFTALRNPDSPVKVGQFVQDLAIVRSPSARADIREKALARLEIAAEWAQQNPPTATLVTPSTEQIVGSPTASTAARGESTPAQRRAAIDRDAQLQAQLAVAPTEFDREQIRAQMRANNEIKMGMALSEQKTPESQAKPQTLTPTEQKILDEAAQAGATTSRNKSPAADAAMKRIEDRNGVASQDEADLLATEGYGQPYDRIDPALKTGASDATGKPRSTTRFGDQGAEERARQEEFDARNAEGSAKIGQRATPDQAPAAAPAGPSSAQVTEILRTPAFQRSAADKAILARASQSFSPEQITLLERTAITAPATHSTADRMALRTLQEQEASNITQSTERGTLEQAAKAGAPVDVVAPNVPATAGSGTAVFRKRRATLAAIAESGLTTVERRNDGNFFMVDGTRKRQYKLSGPADAALARKAVKDLIDGKANAAATSPANDRSEPTGAQIDAVNWKKGDKFQLNGQTVVIENPKGSTRRSKPGAEKPWETKMASHYGDLAGTKGADGDPVDVFIGPDPSNGKVFVIDQTNADGSFDEHKVMMGYADEAAARAGYLANYEKGWTGLGAITEIAPAEFNTWVKSDAATKPLGNINGNTGSSAGVPADSRIDAGDDPSAGVGAGRDRPGVRSNQSAGADTAVPGNSSGKPVAAASQSAANDHVDVFIDGVATRIGLTSKEPAYAGVMRTIAKKFGKQVKFFTSGTDSDGFVVGTQPNIIFLNGTKSSINPMAVFGHELLHLIKKDSPKIYKALQKVVTAQIKKGQNAAYRREYFGELTNGESYIDNPLMEDEAEELVSDVGGNLMADPAFWKEVFAEMSVGQDEQTKGMIAKLSSMVYKLIDDLMVTLRAQSAKLPQREQFAFAQGISDLEKVRAAFKTGMASYIQANGISQAAMQGEILKAGQSAKMSPIRRNDLLAAKMGRINIKSTDDFWKSWTNFMLGTAGPDPRLSAIGSSQTTEQRVKAMVGNHAKEARRFGLLGVLKQYDIKPSEKTNGAGVDGMVMSGIAKKILISAGISPTVENAVAAYDSLVGSEPAANQSPNGIQPRAQSTVGKQGIEGFERSFNKPPFNFPPASNQASLVNDQPDQNNADITKSPARDNDADATQNPLPETNRNDSAARLGQAASADAGGAPEYGAARAGAVSVLARHYADQPRSSLSGAAFGTGLKGAERKRLEGADPRLSKRIYFYVDQGNGIRPESGVGAFAHEVRLNNIYDPASKLVTYKGGANEFEAAVLDAGFDGYMAPSTRTQGAVVLLGNKHRNVPVQQVGKPKDAALPADAKPTAKAEVLMSKELNRIDLSAIPGATLRSGTLTVPEGAFQAANKEMARIDSVIRFSPSRGADALASEYDKVVAQFKGTDGWLKAPNGNATKLNERQWVHVRTPAFAKWFGDWQSFAGLPGGVWNDSDGKVSKAVDSNGEPLVLYHGADSGGFATFNTPGGKMRGDVGIFTSDNWHTAASYVTRGRAKTLQAADVGGTNDDVAAWWNDEGGANEETPFADLTPAQVADARETYRDEVESYADKTPGVYALFVNLRNPGEEDFEGAIWNGEREDQFSVNVTTDEEQFTDSTGRRIFSREEADTIAQANDGDVVPAQGHWGNTDDAVREARSNNQDGAIIRQVIDDGPGGAGRNDVSDVFVAFDPNQLKSADFNGGEYSVSTDDIRFSPVRLERVDPLEMSTRAPYAKSSKTYTPDASGDLIISDFSAGKRQAGWLSAVSDLVTQYPNYREAAGAKTPEAKLERLIRQMTNNLIWLHDQVPADTRSRSKLWYDGANTIANAMSRKYDIAVPQASGILAALSPQKDWFMNVSLADRVASIMAERQSFAWSRKMSAKSDEIFGDAAYTDDIDAIRDKTLAELDSPYLRAMWVRVYDEAHNPRSFMIVSPEGDMVAEAKTKSGELAKPAWGGVATIAKAVSIFEDGSAKNISNQLGRKHKVRNFYNNILVPDSPNGHVTIDTHAVAAALLRPLSGNSLEVKQNFGGPSNAQEGLQGTYALYEEAYRRAAETLSILPRELQSITWEAVRGMFVPGFKSQATNVADIDKIWNQYQKGKASYENTRKQVLDAAGGIDAPSWSGRDPGAYVGDEEASDGGDVSGNELPGRRAADDSRAVGRDTRDATPAGPIQQSPARDGGGRDQSGELAPLEGAPTVLGATGPDPRLVQVAETYAKAKGITLRRQAAYVAIDPARAARIAQAYTAMPHAPQEPKVLAAYAEMIAQTKDQYQALVDAGYSFSFFDSSSDPYEGNPWNAMRDLRANQRMAVYGTYDGYGTEGLTQGAVENNPMLAETGLMWRDQAGIEHPVTANDLFRAVHDAFGHGIEGAGFRAEGEENAWQAHSRLFTGPALGAITSETRGQNSWLNYGPYGERNRTAKLEGTVFADQKTGLMPEWTWTEGRAGDMPSSKKSDDSLAPSKTSATMPKQNVVRPEALIELRKRKSVLESLRKCIGS